MNWDKFLLFGRLVFGLGSWGRGNGERGEEIGFFLIVFWGSSWINGSFTGDEVVGCSLF